MECLTWSISQVQLNFFLDPLCAVCNLERPGHDWQNCLWALFHWYTRHPTVSLLTDLWSNHTSRPSCDSQLDNYEENSIPTAVSSTTPYSLKPKVNSRIPHCEWIPRCQNTEPMVIITPHEHVARVKLKLFYIIIQLTVTLTWTQTKFFPCFFLFDVHVQLPLLGWRDFERVGGPEAKTILALWYYKITSTSWGRDHVVPPWFQSETQSCLTPQSCFTSPCRSYGAWGKWFLYMTTGVYFRGEPRIFERARIYHAPGIPKWGYTPFW